MLLSNSCTLRVSLRLVLSYVSMLLLLLLLLNLSVHSYISLEKNSL